MKFYKVIFWIFSFIGFTVNSFANELIATQDFKNTFAKVTKVQGDLIDMGNMNGYQSKKILSTPITMDIMKKYTSNWGKINESSNFLSFTTIADYDYLKKNYPSDIYYQCVGFIKVATKIFKSSGSDWYKFNNTNISDKNQPKPYSVIATFNKENKYEGHTALVLSSNNQGVFIVDQNWNYDGEILFHFIPYGKEENKQFGSKGVGYAINYYIVGYK